MRWWNISAAKRDLSDAKISPRTLLPYVLAFALMETAVVQFSFLAPANDDFGARQWLLGCLAIAISALGVLHVYRSNGGAQGTLFLERFLVLGWVVGIRYSVAVFLLFVVVVFVLPSDSEHADWTLDLAIPLFFIVSLAVYYLYLAYHIASLANASKDANAA